MARVLLLITLALLIGAIALPLIQVSGGGDTRSLAQLGRPGLAPLGNGSAEAGITWWLVGMFVALVVQAVTVCLALAQAWPRWAATISGIIGVFVLIASLVTTMFALLVQVGGEMEAGPAVWCLVLAEVLYLVVMFAPSLVSSWQRPPQVSA